MVFRNDDISKLTEVDIFAQTHEVFNEYKCINTIAILTKGLECNTKLIDYLKKQNNIDYQVHAYQHLDFALCSEAEARFQLKQSKVIIEEIFGKVPTVFYPPFNSINERVVQIASEEGLRTSVNKVSCLYYIKHSGNVIDKILNWHYWDYCEQILIEPCLKIYKEKLCQQL